MPVSVAILVSELPYLSLYKAFNLVFTFSAYVIGFHSISINYNNVQIAYIHLETKQLQLLIIPFHYILHEAFPRGSS